MSQKNLNKELAEIDTAMTQLENDRLILIRKIEGAGARKAAMATLIPFPSKSAITVEQSGDLAWAKSTTSK